MTEPELTDDSLLFVDLGRPLGSESVYSGGVHTVTMRADGARWEGMVVGGQQTTIPVSPCYPAKNDLFQRSISLRSYRIN